MSVINDKRLYMRLLLPGWLISIMDKCPFERVTLSGKVYIELVEVKGENHAKITITLLVPSVPEAFEGTLPKTLKPRINT